MSPDSLTNRLLGYPADARLLIINADDFGMCHAVNTAVIGTLQAGIVQSTTLMVPCPWAHHAMHFLAGQPDLSFGVHLTVLADWDDYRWGPVTSSDKVPSLVNKTGHFYNFAQMPQLLHQVSLAELELEFRAQIETVLAAGLQPSHLDWHALRLNRHEAIWTLLFNLAQDYGLALRVRGQAWINAVQSHGLPSVDYDFLDSYLLEPATKADRYVELLRELPAGLSEWAVHPGLSNAELSAIDPGGHSYRQADYDFFTSPQMLDVIAAEGIILLDYRALQKVWQGK